MMEQMTTEKADDFQAPVPLTESDHRVSVRKCLVKKEHLVFDGDVEDLDLKEAVALLAPTSSHRARFNVMKLKAGQYVGVKKSDLSNFVIVNPTGDGDIRWLVRDRPELLSDIRDIYYVDGVQIRRNTIDLTKESRG
jgi:hypothetical protein